MVVLTSASLVGLLVISIYRFIRFKESRRFIIQLLVIGACFGCLYFLFYAPEIPTPMGGWNNDIYFVIVLYICMLLGMLAQYGYTHLTQPNNNGNRFDPGLFIAPVLASPIVFIPLLAALQNADVDLQNLTTTKMMVFFVAFENGFFWKAYFDNRRQAGEEDDAADE